VAAWYGHIFAGGTWELLCGPCQDEGEAARALEVAARRRGVVLRPGNTRLTRSASPPDKEGEGQGPGAQEGEK
jgi:hypothetical protein